MSTKSKGHLLIKATILLCFIGVCVFSYWFFYGRFEKSTEDAYVSGHIVEVAPKISGHIVSVHAFETMKVNEGELLVTLDDKERRIAFEKAKAVFSASLREVAEKFQGVWSIFYDLKRAKDLYEKAQSDLERRILLFSSKSISKEELTHAETAYEAALNSCRMIEKKLEGERAALYGTSITSHPIVKQAEENLKEAFIALKRCSIYAPLKGVIGKRGAEVGESVSLQKPLFSIVPLDEVWVDANFKEVDIGQIKEGQPVTLTSDLYGKGVVYQGYVVGIGCGSGSVFSLLPPQNATGNWIKIVQRIPVRIALDKEDIEKYPLPLGSSMRVKVHLDKKTRFFSPLAEEEEKVDRTSIFDRDLEGAKRVIETVIKASGVENFPSDLPPVEK